MAGATTPKPSATTRATAASTQIWAGMGFSLGPLMTARMLSRCVDAGPGAQIVCRYLRGCQDVRVPVTDPHSAMLRRRSILSAGLS